MTDTTTNDTSILPRDLLIVAWAFIGLGALSLLATAASFVTAPTPQIDFLMVLILVGWGLMRKKPFFRLFALTCSVVVLVFYGLPILFIALGVYGIAEASTILKTIFWVQSILSTGFGAWAVYVLNRPTVKRLFEK